MLNTRQKIVVTGVFLEKTQGLFTDKMIELNLAPHVACMMLTMTARD
jgi:hypothetical protein